MFGDPQIRALSQKAVFDHTLYGRRMIDEPQLAGRRSGLIKT